MRGRCSYWFATIAVQDKASGRFLFFNRLTVKAAGTKKFPWRKILALLDYSTGYEAWDVHIVYFTETTKQDTQHYDMSRHLIEV